jgi:uncharacterized protein YdeI (YjbR/CyaY-like superfamily)
MEPCPQQRRGFHVSGKYAPRTADKSVDAQPVHPGTQFVGVEAVKQRPDPVRACAIAAQEGIRRLGVGDVHPALAGHQELATDRWHGVVDVHRQALPGQHLGGHETGRSSANNNGAIVADGFLGRHSGHGIVDGGGLANYKRSHAGGDPSTRRMLPGCDTVDSLRPPHNPVRHHMDSPTLTFADQQAWEVWLEANGGSASGVWLRIAKRSAGEATVSYAQAIESALCHGWIDGQKQTESEHYWLQRFTPRTASIWSRINKEKAEALIAAGRMRPAGFRAVEQARRDGRWEAACIPEQGDRARRSAAGPRRQPQGQEILRHPEQPEPLRHSVQNQNVKKAETRARKIAQFIEMLNKGEDPSLNPTAAPGQR